MFDAKKWQRNPPTCVPVNHLDVEALRNMIKIVTPRMDAERHKVCPGDSVAFC
jgi:hypothetical protein